MIIGHEENLDFLEKARVGGRLAQVYCFSGPDQVGKRSVARELAGRIFNLEPEKLERHPDFFFLEREFDEKKEQLKKDISVNQARSARAFLANRSWLGGWKIVVVDEAERLSEEAANALLKSLEETEEGSLVILLTIDEGVLPATVRSRCQILRFSLVADEKMRVGLNQIGHSGERLERALAAAWGRPGKVIQLLSDVGLLEDYESETSRWGELFSLPFYARLERLKDIFEDKDATRGRDRLKKIMELWTMNWREVLLGRRPLAGGTPPDAPARAAAAIETLAAARALLDRNVNSRLVAEKILLKTF